MENCIICSIPLRKSKFGSYCNFLYENGESQSHFAYISENNYTIRYNELYFVIKDNNLKIFNKNYFIILKIDNFNLTIKTTSNLDKILLLL